METIPYEKRTSTVRLLMDKKYLRRLPFQIKRDDLQLNEGVDIMYEFRSLTPEKFSDAADLLMLAVVEECARYRAPVQYVQFDVNLNRNARGKSKIKAKRSYIASRHSDPDTLVYGEQALGYVLPEGEARPYVINKIKDILGIPESPSPGIYVKKQKPYNVIRMIIALRAR